MTWTSDYRAQWAGLKGLCASGLKGLEPIYYSIPFTTTTMMLAMRWAAQKISVSHSNLPTPSKFKVWGRGEQKNFMEIHNATYFNYFILIYVLWIFYCTIIIFLLYINLLLEQNNKNIMQNFCKHTRRKVYNWWEQLFGLKVQNYFLKCRNTYVSEWGWSEASGKGNKRSVE